MKDVALKIRNIRELKNLTQEYMAERLEMSQAGYSKIENGQTNVSHSKLNEIANILGVKPEEIMTFDGQKYFNSPNNVKGNNNGITIQPFDEEIKKLYEDKISLLEKLLSKTEIELERYKRKFGE